MNWSGFHYIRAHFSCMKDKEEACQQLNLMIWCSQTLLTMPNTSDGHVQCGESKGTPKRRRKSNLLKKQFWELPTPSSLSSALFSIEIIQSERNVLCISQLNSSKAPSTQSVKKGAFFTYTEIEIWFEPYHDRDSTYGAKKGGVHLN